MSDGPLAASASPERVVIPPSVGAWLERLGRLSQERKVAAFAVGGCVRDWLLEVPTTTDLDVTVEGDGIGFAEFAARALGMTMIAHRQFGTATLMVQPEPAEKKAERPRRRRVERVSLPEIIRIDVASCRRESYSAPAAYPKTEPGSLRDDLFRRDFTVNAMAASIDPDRFGVMVDLFGGLRDLAARQLRILHSHSFIDDPSRILRAARFAERFDFRLEPETDRLMRAALADGVLEQLNRGRLRKELDRIVEERDPLACLRRLGNWLNAAP